MPCVARRAALIALPAWSHPASTLPQALPCSSHGPLRMSNCLTVDLPELNVETHQVTEVLRCLLHTIIFNRSLGVVTPRDVDAELFDLTWVRKLPCLTTASCPCSPPPSPPPAPALPQAHCGDPSVDATVEDRTSKVQAWVDRNSGRRLQVVLSFYERRQQQGWFSLQEQRVYWEQWVITLNVLDSVVELEERHVLEAGSGKGQKHCRGTPSTPLFPIKTPLIFFNSTPFRFPTPLPCSPSPSQAPAAVHFGAVPHRHRCSGERLEGSHPTRGLRRSAHLPI